MTLAQMCSYKDLNYGNPISGNCLTEELTISNNVYADKDLEVMGNVYVDGNVTLTPQLFT